MTDAELKALAEKATPVELRRQIPNETLADWIKRWPSTLPTSVPHEQVLMLIENLVESRSRLSRAEARCARLEKALSDLIVEIVQLTGQPYGNLHENDFRIGQARAALSEKEGEV